LGSVKKEVGFTLIELLVSIGIISILAAIAISYYQSYKVRTYDVVAMSDLKNAITAIENYYLDNNIYPDDYSDLLGNGFNFSKNVCFTKFHEHDAGMTVHMHIMHTASPNAWHTKYPDDLGNVDHRTAESCL
jgi:prepilin-type N-terminal cleavage/methylation domain-containing protein